MVDLIDLSRNLDRSSKKCQLWFLTSFFSNFILQFLDAQCLESILFIRGERETFCLHSGQIWALDWIGKDHNRWLKGAIMDCENWLLKDGQVGYFGVALKHIYWGSRPERYALGCGTMLDHHGGVWYIFFLLLFGKIALLWLKRVVFLKWNDVVLAIKILI